MRWVTVGGHWHATPYNFIVAPQPDPDGAMQAHATPTFCGRPIEVQAGVALSVTDERPSQDLCGRCDELAFAFLEGDSKQ